MNNKNNLSTFTNKGPSNGTIRLNGDKLAKYGIATGFATMAFSSFGAKAGWLDKEQAEKIGLTGLGITCTSSIPFIQKELDETKIANTILTAAKDVLALGGN